MAFIKLIFVILILIPVAVIMFALMNKLLFDFSASVRNGRERLHEYDYDRRRKSGTVRENSMKGNSSYEAYKKSRLKYEHRK